jgi:hypothetical protein
MAMADKAIATETCFYDIKRLMPRMLRIGIRTLAELLRGLPERAIPV